MISLTRTLRVCVPLAAAAALAMTGTAFGGSDPNCNPDHGACAFSFDSGPYAFTAPAGPIDCLGPQDGTASGTAQDTGAGTFSNNAANPFFHFRTRHTETGRMDFPYGYVLYRYDQHSVYTSGSRTPTLTFTSPVNARGTVYGTDGLPTGQTVSAHVLEHFTWIDTDGNGQPDPGDDYKSSVTRVSVNCN